MGAVMTTWNSKRLMFVSALLTFLWAETVLAESPVEGAWRVTKSEVDGNVNESPQPALFIFTSTHYSIMIATGDEPRAQSAGEQSTDSEKVVAHDSFVANSGRYEIDGNTIKIRAWVAKSPNYMGGWPDNEQSLEFERDGDTLTISGVGPTNSNFTLQRAEGAPVPW